MIQGRKIAYMLLSLFSALLLWIYVVSTVAPEATQTIGGIRVSIDGSLALEERGLVITELKTERISIEVNTSRINLSRLNAENISVAADASKIREPGEYELSYTISFPDTVNSNDIDILRKSVNTIAVKVEQLESKTLPLELNTTGSVQDGFVFESDSVTMDPGEITVTAPIDELRTVARAVVSYDISQLTQTTVEAVPIALLDESGEEIQLSDFGSVSASQANVTLPVYATKVLTLSVVLQEGGGVLESNAIVNLDHETIQVKGAVDVLSQMDDTLILGTVDLASVSLRKDFFFPIVLPAGVTNLSGDNQVKVSVSISGVRSKDFTVTNIEPINLADDFTVEINTRSLKVTLRGASDDIAAISEDDIQVVVDLKDYDKTGSYTVTGQVSLDKDLYVGVIGTVEIGVTIGYEGSDEA